MILFFVIFCFLFFFLCFYFLCFKKESKNPYIYLFTYVCVARVTNVLRVFFSCFCVFGYEGRGGERREKETIISYFVPPPSRDDDDKVQSAYLCAPLILFSCLGKKS